MVSVLGSMVTLLWYFLVFRNPETHLNYRKASLKTGIDAKMRDICQHVPGLLFGVSEVILRKRSERCWAADVAVTIPEGGSRTTQAGQNTMNMFTSSYIFGGGGPLQLWPAGEAAGREQEGSFTLSFSSVFGGGENEMGTSVPAINLLTDTVSTLLPYFALQAAFQVYYFSFIFVNYKLTNSWPYAILGYVHSRGVKAWALFISCCYVAALILTAVVVLV
ncbi:unnamed protein product [Amoebophrya sp. A120]|nr:unnamed protein product [Amoebophrya sp. A120]|eukprot:GSA120T00008730001.1